MKHTVHIKFYFFLFQVPEIFTFLLLLSVFMFAYGVGSQAVIDPYRESTWDNARKLLPYIFFLPYWQMYGELSLDE